jgi:hypothetical protein
VARENETGISSREMNGLSAIVRVILSKNLVTFFEAVMRQRKAMETSSILARVFSMVLLDIFRHYWEPNYIICLEETSINQEGNLSMSLTT